MKLLILLYRIILVFIFILIFFIPSSYSFELRYYENGELVPEYIEKVEPSIDMFFATNVIAMHIKDTWHICPLGNPEYIMEILDGKGEFLVVTGGPTIFHRNFRSCLLVLWQN